MRFDIFTSGRFLTLALAFAACAPQASPDLGKALIGIEKSRFLTCSGPPLLSYPTGSQDRMSFMTDLQRGQQIGAHRPGALAPATCSADALFENSRLVRVNFGGDLTMCQYVFGPCLPK